MKERGQIGAVRKSGGFPTRNFNVGRRPPCRMRSLIPFHTGVLGLRSGGPVVGCGVLWHLW